MSNLLYSDALFSKDRIYRYALWRTWDESKPKVLFVGLNPSTASHSNDDQTLKNQKSLKLIQNQDNILFCGSYFGYGFHEDGVKSSLEMIKNLNV